jgi:hypothetical protein
MSQLISAAAYTEAALIAVGDALTESTNPEDFLAWVDAISGKPENVLSLPYDLGPPEPLGPAKGGAGLDAANGPAVFEYIGALDASNASDPRLWTFMAFNSYRPYMEARWPLIGWVNWKSRAQNRWLLRGTTRGRLVRHGIARLWWVTNLTYDAGRKYALSKADADPYAYARAVFRNEDRINALFDREAGAIVSVTRAVLEHAAQNSVFAKDNHVRAVMKELTLILGFRDLGLLDADALAQLIEEVRPRYDGDNDKGAWIDGIT